MQSSKIIHVNSSDRVSGTNEKFKYTFALSLEEHYTHCVVLQASIPISYYLIQQGYNTFTLSENGTPVVISIPAGNYNIVSFIRTVVPLLNSNSPHGYTYAIAKNDPFVTVDDGKFYYTVSGNGSVQPQFIFGENVYEQFGFNANSTVSFVANALTSTNVVDFIPEQTLYIYSDLVQTKNNNTLGILQELFTSNYVPYSNIAYQCTSLEGYSKQINDHKTNSFSIVLQNESGQIMNLNGRDMLLTILLYKKDDFPDIVKKYIKYSLTSD